MEKNVVEINKANIEKALETLGINQELLNDNPFIEKGHKETVEDEKKETKEHEKKETPEEEKEEHEDMDEESKELMKSAEYKEHFNAMLEAEGAKSPKDLKGEAKKEFFAKVNASWKSKKEKGEKVEKSELSNDLIKSIDSLQLEVSNYKGEVEGLKGIVSKGFDVIAQNFSDMKLGFEEMNKKFLALGYVEKGILDGIDDLTKRTSNLENTPDKRKSITKKDQVIERNFGKGNGDIEKGQDDDLNKAILSLSKDRRKIIDLLSKKAGLDSAKPDARFTQALLDYEASNTMNKSIAVDILKSENIEIVQ